MDLRKAQHLCRFVLADGHRLNAAAVNLCEIGRVVEHEADDGCNKAVIIRQRHIPFKADDQEARREIHHHQLQHQRCAAHDADEKPGQPAQWLDFGHAAKGDQQAKRHAQHQREDKDRPCHQKPLAKLGENRLHVDSSR